MVTVGGDQNQVLSSPLTRLTSTLTGFSYLSSNHIGRNLRRVYICVHGWGCAGSDYAPLLSALSNSENKEPDTLYVAVDLPGHGKTPRSVLGDPTVTGFAELINQLRQELSPSDFDGQHELTIVLVGHSMGCRIVLEAFALQPAHISGIVLLDGSWYGSEAKDYKISDSVDEDEERQFIVDTLPTMFGPLTPDDFQKRVLQHLRDIELDYANRLSESYIRWDGERMEGILTTIAKGDGGGGNLPRVMVVDATEGRGSKRRTLQRDEESSWMSFVREKVGKKYYGVVVERSGHWPHVDHPEEVAHAMKRFENT